MPRFLENVPPTTVSQAPLLCLLCTLDIDRSMRVLQYSQNDSKTHQISRKHKHMRVIQSHQVKYRILPLNWVCGLYPGTILSLIAIQVWCEVTTNRPRRQSPIIFCQNKQSILHRPNLPGSSVDTLYRRTNCWQLTETIAVQPKILQTSKP